MTNTVTYPARVGRDHVMDGVAAALRRRFDGERHAAKKLQKLFGWSESKTRHVLGGRLAVTAADLLNLIDTFGPEFAEEIIESALDTGPRGCERRRKVKTILAKLEPVLMRELDQ